VRILFDQGTPVPLRRYLVGHEVVTAFEKGWSTLKNGELLQAAENNDFTVLLTTDMNLRYQQDLSIRKISVVVLSTTSWPRIKSEVSAVAEAVAASTTGSYIEVIIP
jgi:predicted nuclease of predicted toxin-antitoxin system